MSYMKIGTQKQKLDKNTSACQMSLKTLEENLTKTSSKKLKAKIKREIELRQK